jgi:hypothetical protein
MDLTPGPRLVSTRQCMDRYFRLELSGADFGDEPGYGLNTGRWLASQLPASDPVWLGWGLVAVTAVLCPGSNGAGFGEILKMATASPRHRKGRSIALLMASRVGDALINTEGSPSPAGRTLEVGPELAAADFLGSPPESPWPGWIRVEEVRGDFREHMRTELDVIRQLLAGELPGADPGAIGWAVTGTARMLLKQAAEPRAPGRPGPSAWRQADVRSGMATTAFLLGVVGDFLIDQG